MSVLPPLSEFVKFVGLMVQMQDSKEYTEEKFRMLLQQCEFIKIDYERLVDYVKELEGELDEQKQQNIQLDRKFNTERKKSESVQKKLNYTLEMLESEQKARRETEKVLELERKEKYEANYLQGYVETPPDALRRHQTQTTHNIFEFPDLTIQLEQTEYDLLRCKTSQVSSLPSRSTRQSRIEPGPSEKIIAETNFTIPTDNREPIHVNSTIATVPHSLSTLLKPCSVEIENLQHFFTPQILSNSKINNLVREGSVETIEDSTRSSATLVMEDITLKDDGSFLAAFENDLQNGMAVSEPISTPSPQPSTSGITKSMKSCVIEPLRSNTQSLPEPGPTGKIVAATNVTIPIHNESTTASILHSDTTLLASFSDENPQHSSTMRDVSSEIDSTETSLIHPISSESEDDEIFFDSTSSESEDDDWRGTNSKKATASKHVCKICCKEFTQRSPLRTHLASAHNIGEHRCEVCRLTFAFPAHLKEHCKKKHGS